MKRIIPLVATVATLTGCTSNETIRQKSFGLKQTAAVQALGPGAYPTALVRPSILKPGRIYHQGADGSFYEICERDVDKQNALKSMQIVDESRPQDQVEDTVYQVSIDASALGRARLPYERVKVTGYTVSSVDGIGDVPSYILENVATKCKFETLPRNTPYFITTSVAVADKAETFSRSFVDSVDIGPIRYEGGAETAGPTRANVVFATKARRYK